MNSLKLVRRVVLTFLCLAVFPLAYPAIQEKRVNQKKIEREREQKRKKALKDYEAGVKRHKKMQSKETKASMKRSKKESVKKTPIQR